MPAVAATTTTAAAAAASTGQVNFPSLVYTPPGDGDTEGTFAVSKFNPTGVEGRRAVAAFQEKLNEGEGEDNRKPLVERLTAAAVAISTPDYAQQFGGKRRRRKSRRRRKRKSRRGGGRRRKRRTRRR